MDTTYVREENISLASGEEGDDSDEEEEVKIEEAGMMNYEVNSNNVTD